MDIKRYIEEAHENFVSAGEYRCLECGGGGDFPDPDGGAEWHCKHCNGTGIDPRKNIGELLMRIVGELCNAEEAHREDRFAKESKYCNFENIYQDINGIMMLNYILFENNFANTYEDHIAMAFIKIFDLCGYLEIIVQPDDSSCLDSTIWRKMMVSDVLLLAVRCISNLQDESRNKRDGIESAIGYLNSICRKHNIPIQKHIEARLAYDRSAIDG
jgi:hypothetical protein